MNTTSKNHRRPAASRPARFESLEPRVVFDVEVSEIPPFEIPRFDPPPMIEGPDHLWQWQNSAQLSGDGRYVVFESSATNLVANDNNGARDIFLKDFATGVTTLISASAGGAAGNGDSYGANISADGRYVSFVSRANNFVATDTNEYADVYVKDLRTGALVCVTEGKNWQWDFSASLSADGRHVVYGRGWDPHWNYLMIAIRPSVTIVDLQTRHEEDLWNVEVSRALSTKPMNLNDGYLLSVGHAPSAATITVYPSAAAAAEALRGLAWTSNRMLVSIDGRTVVDDSTAVGIEDGDTRPLQVYVRNIATDEQQLASTDSEGNPLPFGGGGPAISADGRRVVFSTRTGGDFFSDVRIVVKDLVTGELRTITEMPVTARKSFDISADGRYVLVIGGDGSGGGEKVIDGVYRYAVDPRGEHAPLINGDLDESGALDPQDYAWALWLVNRFQGELTATLPTEAVGLKVDQNDDGLFDSQDVLLTLTAVNRALNPDRDTPWILANQSAPEESLLLAMALDAAQAAEKKRDAEAAATLPN